MRRSAALLLVTALAATACVTAPPPEAGPWKGTWAYQGSRDYEARLPGFGASHRFSSEIGWIDIYVYGLRRSNWAAGVADPAFGEHFASVLDEVLAAERQGYYRDVKIAPAEDVEIAGVVFRHAAMRYRNDNRPIESHVYLAGVNGHLLKFRMSFYAPAPANLDAIMREFIAGHIPKQLPSGPMRSI